MVVVADFFYLVMLEVGRLAEAGHSQQPINVGPCAVDGLGGRLVCIDAVLHFSFLSFHSNAVS